MIKQISILVYAGLFLPIILLGIILESTKIWFGVGQTLVNTYFDDGK